MSEASNAFPQTRWTEVELAGKTGDSAHLPALDEVLGRYLPALRVFLETQFRSVAGQAEDLLQGFVEERVLEGGLLSQADRRRGRFRTFLVRSLCHYVISQMRRSSARKRSPEEGTVSLDALDENAAVFAVSPGAAAFDQAFARQVVLEAARRMEQECTLGGRGDLWGVFTSRILGPILHESPPADYQTLVQQHGFRSPGHASNALITAKRMYARNLRAVLAEFVVGDDEIEAELRDLRAILASGGGGAAAVGTNGSRGIVPS